MPYETCIQCHLPAGHLEAGLCASCAVPGFRRETLAPGQRYEIVFLTRDRVDERIFVNTLAEVKRVINTKKATDPNYFTVESRSGIPGDVWVNDLRDNKEYSVDLDWQLTEM